MTFSESAPRQEAPRDTGRGRKVESTETKDFAIDKQLEYTEARAETRIATKNSLGDLKQKIEWSGIPDSAQQYMKEQCAPAQIPYAITYLRNIKAQEFGGIGNIPEEFWPMVLDSCIKYAKENSEIAAIDKELKSDAETIATNEQGLEEQRTTVKGLRNDITEAAKGKNGHEQIQFAQQLLEQKLTEVNLPEEQKEELRAWLGGIAATLGNLTTLIDDPDEANAFAALVATSSFNLTADNNYDIFSNLMVSVDNSDEISTETADRLRVQGLGIPTSFRDTTDLFQTLDQVRDSNGQFRKNGKIVDFNEDNGIDLGRYSIHPDQTDKSGFVAKTQVGGRTLRVRFNRNTNPNLVDEMISSAMISQVLANRDFQAANRYILGGDGLAAQGVTDIRLDEFQVKRAEQLYGAFMGFGTELRTGFPDQSELREFERRLQATHIDGDAKTGDNTGRGDLSWQQIGMVTKNGDIDMNMVETVGAYVNGEDRTSLPLYENLVARFGNASNEVAK